MRTKRSEIVTTKQPVMTKEEALSFDRYSPTNADIVRHAFSACGCEAYKSAFTYNRWKAIGWQVQKGQKGTKINIIKIIKEDGQPDRQVFRTSTIFCKHQVERLE